MKNIFTDVNVLITVCNKEYPHFFFASMLVSLAKRPGFCLYTSPLFMAILFYYAEKKAGYEKAKQKMLSITKNFSFTDHQPDDITNVFSNKKIHDVEDGLQYYSALRSKCEFIVTQDTGDFYFSEIPVLTAENFMKQS